MRRQWLFVLVVIVGLGVGAWALTRFGQRSLPIEVGNEAPDFSAVNLKTGDTVSLNRT